mmetsp:Transcript_19311/g.59988  ORF Transcript_19311/g.59988 Transcript_19311/m.59988 type:complete len:143 (+) Transcript_19311:872-1300(+)
MQHRSCRSYPVGQPLCRGRDARRRGERARVLPLVDRPPQGRGLRPGGQDRPAEHDEQLRHTHRVSTEEADALRQQNTDLRAALADVTALYDAIKEYGDAIKPEQQLSAAVSRLDKTKHGMHNLLQTQLTLSDIAEAAESLVP